MNDEVGPQLEGWGTWPYLMTVSLFVVVLVAVVAMVRRAIRGVQGWRRVLLIAGVVVVALVTLFLLSQPSTAHYGPRTILCDYYGHGALSDAFSRGDPDDSVLGDTQVACRTASRIQSVVAALIVGITMAGLYLLRRLLARRVTTG